MFQVMLDTQHEESRAELERIEHLRKLKQLQKQEKKIHHWLFDSVGKWKFVFARFQPAEYI